MINPPEQELEVLRLDVESHVLEEMPELRQAEEAPAFRVMPVEDRLEGVVLSGLWFLVRCLGHLVVDCSGIVWSSPGHFWWWLSGCHLVLAMPSSAVSRSDSQTCRSVSVVADGLLRRRSVTKPIATPRVRRIPNASPRLHLVARGTHCG